MMVVRLDDSVHDCILDQESLTCGDDSRAIIEVSWLRDIQHHYML